MPSYSRIVFAEDLGVISPWRPDRLEDQRGGRGEPAEPEEPPPPTYDDGVRDGIARGLEQARREVEQARRAEREAIARRGDAIVEAMTAELSTLQQSLAGEVTALAVEVARSAFGAALRVRDDAIEPAVVEALGAIVEEHARPVLRLHPDDHALVGEQLAPLLAARGASLVPDPAILPGGCLAETARASVDATVQTRWRRALAALGIEDRWIEG
jgi:flagellar assembly protein FliH